MIMAVICSCHYGSLSGGGSVAQTLGYESSPAGGDGGGNPRIS